MSAKFNDGDCWVFVPKIPVGLPREVWSDSTAPVTNGGPGVDFKIETYTVEDYARIAIDVIADVRYPFNAAVVAKYSASVSTVGNNLWDQLKSQW